MLVNNILREYSKMKEEIKDPKKTINIKTMEKYCVSCEK